MTEPILRTEHENAQDEQSSESSESRESLRDFFEVDARYVVVATLGALARAGQLDASVVAGAIKAQGINPDKLNPAVS